VSEIINHWSFENHPHSDEVVRLLLQGIERATHDSLKPYFDVMKAFVAIKDSLQRRRIELLLAPRGVLTMLHNSRHQQGKYTYVAIKFLLSIIEENEVFAQLMMANRAEWLWIDHWLKCFVGKKQYGAATPPLARQESREQTFTKYQAQVEKYGGTLALEEQQLNDPTRDPGSSSTSLEISKSAPCNQEWVNYNKRQRDSDDQMDESLDRGPLVRADHEYHHASFTSGAVDYRTTLDSTTGAVVPVGPVIDNAPGGPVESVEMGPPPLSPANSVLLNKDTRAVWACPRCTFENDPIYSLCTVCQEGQRD